MSDRDPDKVSETSARHDIQKNVCHFTDIFCVFREKNVLNCLCIILFETVSTDYCRDFTRTNFVLEFICGLELRK